MLDIFRKLFRSSEKPCRACDARVDHITCLYGEIDYWREEYKKMREALFYVSRLEPPKDSPVPRFQVPQYEGAPGQAGQAERGSNKNWSSVKSRLEKLHRRTPESDEKLATWASVNAQAAKEIPELEKALHEKQVVDSEIAENLKVLDDAS